MPSTESVRRFRETPPCRPIGLALGLALLATLAAAQDLTTGVAPIGEVTLFGEEAFTIRAATKTELPISKAPGAVTVISARQIKESGARTIPELLRLVPGVNVRWNPMVQTVDIRGFGQNPFTSRVLLLIDGVPYNSWNKGGFPQHPGFDFFMLHNIKRLEIVRGPGSSLYGENAYWGVINIVTLSGEDLQGGVVEAWSGDLANESLSAIYGRRQGARSFVVSGRTQRAQLPSRFWFEEVDSEVEASDVYLKGRYGGVELSYYRHEDEFDGFSQPGFIPGTTFRSAARIEQTVDIAALKLDHDWGNGVTFGGDVSFARREGSRCASCHAGSQKASFAGTANHGSQWIGDFRLGLSMIPSHDILVGIEARSIDTGDHTDELLDPAATASPVVFAYTKVAGYFQDQISLARDRVRLTLGLRFDGDNDLFDSELSPRIAAVYTPNDRVAIRGGWSTAFRFPTFSELYQDSAFLGLERGPVFIPIVDFEPNPGLRREEIRTFELGTEVRFSPTLSGKVNLFHSEVRDFIVLVFNSSAPGPTRLRSENHPDDAELFGGELEVRWRPSNRVSGLIGWSYQEADQVGDLVDSSGKPFEFVYAPSNKLSLGSYLGPFAGFRAALEVQWRDERLGPSFWNFADPSRTPTLADYTLVDLRVSYEPPLFDRASRGLRFSVYARNLLDEQVAETLLPIDLSLPGATYYGGLEVRF